MQTVYNQLVNKEAKLAVVGLGYVGLPLALAFARHFSVIGFDINEERLAKLQHGIDPSGELTAADFAARDIVFTSSLELLRTARLFVVAVPTPIDLSNNPDLRALLSATRTVGQCLKTGDYVCYESTVYPGCTEEDCVPLLATSSGLSAGIDFKYGYSPERINPGDHEHTLENTQKIVAGCDVEALEQLAAIYETVVKAGVHKAPSIKVAEAGKIIENTQRDVNIALMNELSIIFGRMGINTYDVLDAASTKWNFLKFVPGLVGGHCIGVDPYYLVHKAQELKYHPQIIAAGRFINDSMGGYIGKKIVKQLIRKGKAILGARALIFGVTFKENVSDIRNSKVIDIVNELRDYGVEVDIVDPRADSTDVAREYGFPLLPQPATGYDVVILAVAHREYLNWDEAYISSLGDADLLFVDLKGLYRKQIRNLSYWSL